MAEIEESEEKFGLHVTLGGFPMKAWLKKEGNDTVLAFSNGGRWAKLWEILIDRQRDGRDLRGAFWSI